MARTTTVVAGELVSLVSQPDAVPYGRHKNLPLETPVLDIPSLFAGAMLFVCYSCVILALTNQVPGADGEGRPRPRWYGLPIFAWFVGPVASQRVPAQP